MQKLSCPAEIGPPAFLVVPGRQFKRIGVGAVARPQRKHSAEEMRDFVASEPRYRGGASARIDKVGVEQSSERGKAGFGRIGISGVRSGPVDLSRSRLENE